MPTRPKGVRYWVAEDNDYYASYLYQVLDGAYHDFDADRVAGFNNRHEAQAYADYLNEKEGPYEGQEVDPYPARKPIAHREADKILLAHWATAARKILNTKSSLLGTIQEKE